MHVLCCSAGDGPGELELEDRKNSENLNSQTEGGATRGSMEFLSPKLAWPVGA